MDKRFLSLKEMCGYTGWGMTKAREIVKRKDSTFTLKVGGKYFIDKLKLDAYLDRCMKYHIEI